MKQFAPKVLAIWLASWAIVTLQPCCASILESSESHHSSQNSGNHSDHHVDHHTVHDAHHAEADISHHNSSHDCRIAIENLDDLAVPVTDKFFASYEQQLDIDSVIFFDSFFALTNNTIISYVYNYIHPPPGNNQLYLTTLRIRV